jgi:integrase
LSNLRIFCGWIGKKGLVKNVHYYLPNVPKDELRVKTTALKSKSWAEAGINVVEKVELASQLDWRFGLMLMAQVAFGLRRLEVLQMQPWKCDEGKTFFAYKTKGGRPRLIYIDTEVQRALMDLIKSKIRKSDCLGWPERTDGGKATLVYAERRYNYLMAKIGITKELAEVTGHGLRAQFAENAALLKNLVPPTLGGTPGQMLREDLDLTRLQVSESLGHSRISVTGAYYGSFGPEVPLDSPSRVKDTIMVYMDMIKIDPGVMIPKERLVDCIKLMTELGMIEVYGEPRKVQKLWEHHSQRHATNWLKPSESSNLAALEAAAISIVRSSKGTLDKSSE